MTQSGVSQHVRKLEEQLGRPLLIREGKQFTLTDVGERLYQEAREIVFSLSNLEQHLREDSAYEGVVRVMSPGSVGLKLYLLTIPMELIMPLCYSVQTTPSFSTVTCLKRAAFQTR